MNTKIKVIRKQQGHTTKKIASVLGVTPLYINLIENGRRNLTLKNASKLSEFWGIPINDMIDDEPTD